MDVNDHAPTLHIDDFACEDEAQAQIKDGSEAWFAKQVAAGIMTRLQSRTPLAFGHARC